jgi:hypothetical protein
VAADQRKTNFLLVTGVAQTIEHSLSLCPSSRVVEHSTHNSKIKGLNSVKGTSMGSNDREDSSALAIRSLYSLLRIQQ